MIPQAYPAGEVPAFYVCRSCGVTGVKLWRHWMGFKGLHCTECAKVEYNEEYANPFRPEPVPGTPIPAVSYLDSWDVEKDDEARYQGSILSQHALQWWKSLPTSPAVDPARPAWYL